MGLLGALAGFIFSPEFIAGLVWGFISGTVVMAANIYYKWVKPQLDATDLDLNDALADDETMQDVMQGMPGADWDRGDD